MIIPFFIPHSGCPHQCVFCNQRRITGQNEVPHPSVFQNKIREFLGTDYSRPAWVAFYGGSFTALSPGIQQACLEPVQPFIEAGRIQGIRISTRPDCISEEILIRLQKYQVRIIELGIQSMDDGVLMRSGRGHTASDSIRAVQLLKAYGFGTGLQLMPGLPGDCKETFMETVGQAVKLAPDFVRIYPALVIRDTPLENLFKAGQYSPLPLDAAVALCKKALLQFESAGIDVVRIGLQPSEELERPGTIAAGPYHPAFRQLVESSILLDRMRAVLTGGAASGRAVLTVNPGDLSNAVGQKRANITALKQEFGLRQLSIRTEAAVPRRTVQRESGK